VNAFRVKASASYCSCYCVRTGPVPKLKSSSSAIKIYRENSEGDGGAVKGPLSLHQGLPNLSFETEEDEEKEVDFEVDGCSESDKTCSCHLESGMKKRERSRGRDYILMKMEMIVKV